MSSAHTALGEIYRDWSLTPEERHRRLAEAVRRIRSSLSAEAALLFDGMVAEWERSGKARPPDYLEGWFLPDYVRQPVDIRTFVNDPYYLGQSLGNGYLYPQILDDLEELFEGDYSEVVLGGSIGWGKSRMAEVGIGYDIYLVSCLRNPAAMFGLIPGSSLAFVNVSVKKEQAKKVMFGGLFELFKKSPYFRQTFPYRPNLSTEIQFPKNISCYPVASSEQAVLGEGIFAASIDEANFMWVIERSKRSVPGQSKNAVWDQAKSLYDRMSRRIRSRFNMRGRLPGHLWLISSARYPDDFTERKEREALQDQKIFVRHYASWQTAPKNKFSGKVFQVEVGDLMRRSRILDGTEDDVEKTRIVDIPEDFRTEFEKDVEGCIRDYAGISTLSIKPFIPRREMVQKAIDNGKAAGLQHPFSRFEVLLQPAKPGQPDRDERLLPEYLPWVDIPEVDERGRPMFNDDRTPKLRHVISPSLFYAHVDLSKTGDAAAVCIGYVCGTKIVRRLDTATMEVVSEKKPVVRVVLVLRIMPPKGGEIDIPSVRALFYQLHDLGMQFGLISYDSFASQESVKTLKDQGYEADVYSVDTSNDAYEIAKQALYDERVLMYEQPKELMTNGTTLQVELITLEDTGKKIDHPPNGSKDMADCFAAVVYHCEEGYRTGRAAQMPFMPGLTETPERTLQERALDGDELSWDEFERM